MDDQQAGGPDLQAGAGPDLQEPALPPPLDLVAVKLTDVGRTRTHNEDYVDYTIPVDPGELIRKGAIYLVADGMGGHQAGEVASRGAVELVISHYYSDSSPDVDSSLTQAFQAANQQLHAQSHDDPAKGGMGTTLVAAVILDRQVHVANVGDSRAYLIHQKGITQITQDHSWVEEQVQAGLLTPAQARRHPQRNLVTRALGTRASVDVDLFKGEIGEGDTLLLCSDGLTGRVEDREIASTIREYPPEEAAQRLVDLANEQGGNDNVSVLIVSAQQEPATVRGRAVRSARRERRRSSRLIPILVVATAILALLLVLLALRFLLAGETPPTPTPTLPIPATAAVPGPDASAPGSAIWLSSVLPSVSGTKAAVEPASRLIPARADLAQPQSAGRPTLTSGDEVRADLSTPVCQCASRPTAVRGSAQGSGLTL